MKKLLLAVVGVCLVVIGLNVVRVAVPAYVAIRSDERNDGIVFLAHYPALVVPSELVLDLVAVSAGKSMLDVDRCLFQVAQSFSHRRFERVYLSWRGSTRFVLSGEDFHDIGWSYGEGENPVFLIRTLPEKLKTPDGAAAFSMWTGGLIGVMTRQLDDHKQFHEQWYADSAGLAY